MSLSHSPIPLPADLPAWPLDLALARFSEDHHGDYPDWQAALEALPNMTDITTSYGDIVTVKGTADKQNLEQTLQTFHPWRKGPFQVNDVFIDTEWRSDLKWNRINQSLGQLDGQRILDIGCGNGYFGWRMLEQGAAEVIGIDPTLLFCMQHLVIKHFCQDSRNWVLPLKIEEIPTTTQFDTTLSMGVIYHRRDPQQHVQQLFDLTAQGGQGVLESIVTLGEQTLIPENRYARMRNVWNIPTVDDLRRWMQTAGFQSIDVIDVSPTTETEQRSTAWMRFESLRECLDQSDPSKTVEGYPAPVRATLVGRRDV